MDLCNNTLLKNIYCIVENGRDRSLHDQSNLSRIIMLTEVSHTSLKLRVAWPAGLRQLAFQDDYIILCYLVFFVALCEVLV